MGSTGERVSASSRQTVRLASRSLVLAVFVTSVLGLAGPPLLTPADADVADGSFQTDPTVNFTITPNPAHPGEEITLDASASTVADGSIAYCEFDVDGDGTYDERQDDCVASFPYYATGEYDLAVRVTTTAEVTASATERIVVRENDEPVPVIAVDPTDPQPGESVRLDASGSTDADGTIETYTWRLAGQNRSGDAITTSFQDPGEYTVALTAVDDDGASATARATVTVSANEPPTASLSVAETDVGVGDTVVLDATGSRDPDGTIRGYAWDVDGDGTVDRRTTTGTIEVTPTGVGEQALRVTVFDDRNASDTASARFTVVAAATATTGAESNGTGGGALGVVDPGVIPVVPDAGAALLLVALLGATGLALRRRETVASYAARLRTLLVRGDIRRKLGENVSRKGVKRLAKAAIRRFSDLVETGGEVVGEAVERVGHAIKRGSRRVAEWLRRVGG